MALWDTAMRGCVGLTPLQTWGPSSRCGSTKEGLQQLCLSRSLRRYLAHHLQLQTSRLTVHLTHRPRRCCHQEQQQRNAIPGHLRAGGQSRALIYSNSAGQHARIHKVQDQRGLRRMRSPSNARSPNRLRISRNSTFQHDLELSCNPNCLIKH
jgi:hypothetical protein